mmetsp:Transcript_11799/g.28642  ORF Transcript_11799/g.28642 Transcript_11799/m.28642 type:complete len:595 (-) Transcript_11799:536-2320(-)
MPTRGPHDTCTSAACITPWSVSFSSAAAVSAASSITTSIPSASRSAAKSTASGNLLERCSSTLPARSAAHTASTKPSASPSVSWSQRVRAVTITGGGALRAINTLTIAASTHSPSGAMASRDRSARSSASSSVAIWLSSMRPPNGAATAARPAGAGVLRKSHAVADSRCTGMPSARRSRRSARICSCFRRSPASLSSSRCFFTSRSFAFSMFRSRKGLTRLNMAAMIASRSVGSMSFCRRPLRERPSTCGPSSMASASSLDTFSPAAGPPIPALSAAALAAASSSSLRLLSASGSAASGGASPGRGVGRGPSHTRVYSNRKARGVRPGRSALFHPSSSFGSKPLSLAISSRRWEPRVKNKGAPPTVIRSPGLGSASVISSSQLLGRGVPWSTALADSLVLGRVGFLASLRLGPSTRRRKWARSVKVACARGLERPPPPSRGRSISWSRSSIHASVRATLAPMVQACPASSASSPPCSRRRSSAHFTQSGSHRMKHACTGCRCPSAWNRLHWPMISALVGKWSSQNARGHASHRNSMPPTAAALRPQSWQAWCGHAQRVDAASSSCVTPMHSAWTDTGHRSQHTMSPPSQHDWQV